MVDLNITTGIPCKIINDGHYLDNEEGIDMKNHFQNEQGIRNQPTDV
ncbi:33147_t:CDS:1, partial [Gigaspora margarita]